MYEINVTFFFRSCFYDLFFVLFFITETEKSKMNVSESRQEPVWTLWRSHSDPCGVTETPEESLSSVKRWHSQISPPAPCFTFFSLLFFFFLLSFLFSLTHWFIHTTCCTMAALLSKWDRLNGDLYFQDYICIQLQMIWRKRGQWQWRRRRRVVSILFLCLYE